MSDARELSCGRRSASEHDSSFTETMPQLQEAYSAAKTTDLDQAGDAASTPFVGRWNKLVTTTNWEKGRIIHQWREAMIASGVPVTEYSDEAWARRVSGVTGQHVGRLRRVYQKFGDAYQSYDGLYWSHFQAVLDWEDAEQWLNQAQQRAWSVSQMRNARWESLGVPPEQRAGVEEAIEVELDEDFEPALREKPEPEGLSPTLEHARSTPADDGPRIEGPDFGDADEPEGEAESHDQSGPSDAHQAAPIRPFEQIGELPDDVIEAFEAYKLAIVRHKRENWSEISRDEMLATLESLKELALAPTGEPAPF